MCCGCCLSEVKRSVMKRGECSHQLHSRFCVWGVSLNSCLMFSSVGSTGWTSRKGEEFFSSLMLVGFLSSRSWFHSAGSFQKAFGMMTQHFSWLIEGFIDGCMVAGPKKKTKCSNGGAETADYCCHYLGLSSKFLANSMDGSFWHSTGPPRADIVATELQLGLFQVVKLYCLNHCFPPSSTIPLKLWHHSYIGCYYFTASPTGVSVRLAAR